MIELPSIIKNHPLYILIAGLIMGIAIYGGILKLAHLEVATELSSCPKGEVSLKFETSPRDVKISFADSKKAFIQDSCLKIGRYQFILSSKEHKNTIRTVHLERADRVEVVRLANIISINLSGSDSRNYPKDMERLSLSMQDIEVRAALQLLADFNGFNIAIQPGLTQLVSLRLQNTPWKEAFDMILLLNNLEAHKKNSITVVTKKAR